MFMQPATAFHRAQPVVLAPRSRDGRRTMPAAFAVDARIECETGWVAAGALEPGMAIQTRDGGLRRLEGIERHLRWPVAGACMVRVPGGALGNCAELSLLPTTRIVLPLRAAEAVLGTPEVLVAAGALDGWRGIRCEPVAAVEEAVSLRFAQDEVIWLNTGVQVFCGRGSGYWTEVEAEEARGLLAREDRADRARAA